MRVNIDQFFARYSNAEYRNGLYIPEDIWCQRNNSFLLGETEMEIPDDTYEIIEMNRHKQETYDKHYSDIRFLALSGMQSESEENIDEAIARYAEAIELGESCEENLLHAYHHAYNRIIILLSRTRAYLREASYIEQLLKHELQDSERARLTARLEKTKLKIKKI